jgi:hypothetical protein
MTKRRVLIRGSAGAIVLCIAVLLADYTVAQIRKPADEKVILALQEKVRMDAKLAPVVAAEQDRITRQRRARKTRNGWISKFLIGAVALFLTASRMGRGGRQAVALATIQKVKAGAGSNGAIVLRPPG